MTEVLWIGNPGDVPTGFAGSEEFDVRCVPVEEADGAAQKYRTVDCVVYDPEGGTEEEVLCVLESVCDRLSEVPCVAVGDVEAFPEDAYVLDHIPKRDGWVEVLSDVVSAAVTERSHTSYPVPEDEDRRLEKVEEVGDLELRDAFDRMTEIGRHCFDADMCFVGVIEDRREMFLSCRGGSLDELPREQSVCTYQIVEDGVTVVQDILDDPRFETRERLLELGMRFYAGAPVKVGGVHVGSFCVMDAEPRDLGEDERRILTKFGEEVAEKIRLITERR